MLYNKCQCWRQREYVSDVTYVSSSAVGLTDLALAIGALGYLLALEILVNHQNNFYKRQCTYT
jgi:3-dehydroquinate dehydratase